MSMRCGYVALIGLPNAGKSSLMNALIGEAAAIVTPMPQTTRQRITGLWSSKAAQLIIFDTPGLHVSGKRINQAMMAWSRRAMKDADLACVVLPADDPTEGHDLFAPLFSTPPAAVVLNKMDLLASDAARESVRAVVAQRFPGVPCHAVSAKNGSGVKALRTWLCARLPEGPALFPTDIYTEHPVRFLAAEMIRAGVIRHLRQEIPHHVAIDITEFLEEAALTRITAHIIVERDAHKGIVIGDGGRMIRAIGTMARGAIERLVGTKVYLELRVIVRPQWTTDPQSLTRFGLMPPV